MTSEVFLMSRVSAGEESQLSAPLPQLPGGRGEVSMVTIRMAAEACPNMNTAKRNIKLFTCELVLEINLIIINISTLYILCIYSKYMNKCIPNTNLAESIFHIFIIFSK